MPTQAPACIAHHHNPSTPQARAAEEFGDLGEEGGAEGELGGESHAGETGEERAARKAAAAGALPWSGTDRDYTYEELLGGWRLASGVWLVVGCPCAALFGT